MRISSKLENFVSGYSDIIDMP
ncbi:hypothetical protein F383_19307 [Gossypium arboreum]|uniref:Uncharacterized protein n=1 Tax=Gossypium arboreum TaxID=29729 RepID=A0A0B0NP73_GOSAR|nr:hypothetical protein F383_19307 [Gossypium arboreum]